MAVHILLVRHAEPLNPDKVIYGRLPGFPLNEEGRQQAEDVGRYLAAWRVSHLYTSPLLRTRQTARIIARYHPLTSIHLARPLIETLTSHQGSRAEQIPAGFNYYEPRKQEMDETLEMIFARMDGFFRRLVRRHPDENLVCVSHGDPIATVRAGYGGRPLILQSIRGREYPLKTSVTSLVFEAPGSAPAMTFLRDGPPPIDPLLR